MYLVTECVKSWFFMIEFLSSRFYLQMEQQKDYIVAPALYLIIEFLQPSYTCDLGHLTCRFLTGLSPSSHWQTQERKRE